MQVTGVSKAAITLVQPLLPDDKFNNGPELGFHYVTENPGKNTPEGDRRLPPGSERSFKRVIYSLRLPTLA